MALYGLVLVIVSKGQSDVDGTNVNSELEAAGRGNEDSVPPPNLGAQTIY